MTRHPCGIASYPEGCFGHVSFATLANKAHNYVKGYVRHLHKIKWSNGQRCLDNSNRKIFKGKRRAFHCFDIQMMWHVVQAELVALHTVLAGPLYECQRRKTMRLGFLGRAGHPDDRLCLRKIGSWEKSILFSSKHALSEWQNYCNWESTDRLLVFGWPITSQLSLDTLASLCPCTRHYGCTP